MEQITNNLRRYPKEVLHCVIHMGDYIKEVTSEIGVTPKRAVELRNRFAAAEKLAKQTYIDAFKLNCALDGEQCDDTAAEVAWENAVRCCNTSKYGDYSKDALHTFRHLDNYIEEVGRGDVSPERATELKERFRTLMNQAVHLYIDERHLLLILDA